MGADSGFFEALVRGFQEDAEVAIADLAEALRSSDHSALRRAVHALEGSAGEVGAVRLVAAVRRLRGLQPCELESAGALALLAEVEQLLPMTLHLLEQAAAAVSAQCEP
jgi:two-component system sensor histidine kinase RpfC